MQDFINLHLPQLIDRIYAAALDPELWPQVLERLSEPFGNAYSHIYIENFRNPLNSLHITFGIDRSGTRDFDQHYNGVNPYPEQAQLLGIQPGKVCTALEIIPAEDIDKTEFYADFMTRVGWKKDHIGGMFYKDEARIGVLTVAPQSRLASLSEQDNVRMLELLLPHLQRALQLNRSWAQACRRDEQVSVLLASIEGAVFLLDDNLKIMEMNAQAAKLVATSDVLHADAAGRIHAANDRTNAQLQSALANGRHGAMEQCVPVAMMSASSGARYVAWHIPMSRGDAVDLGYRGGILQTMTPPPCSMIVVKRLGGPISVPAHLISAVMGITEKEAEIACALTNGETLNFYADKTGVSRHTVRKQLASIYAKLDVHSQSELVLLVRELSTQFGD